MEEHNDVMPLMGFEDSDELIKAIDKIMQEKPEHYKKLAKL